jgi:hypothetical protein
VSIYIAFDFSQWNLYCFGPNSPFYAVHPHKNQMIHLGASHWKRFVLEVDKRAHSPQIL